MTRPRAPTPALRALEQADITPEQAAKFLGRSPRALRRALAANDIRSFGVASLLARLCGCCELVFHPISLAREREREER